MRQAFYTLDCRPRLQPRPTAWCIENLSPIKYLHPRPRPAHTRPDGGRGGVIGLADPGGDGFLIGARAYQAWISHNMICATERSGSHLAGPTRQPRGPIPSVCFRALRNLLNARPLVLAPPSKMAWRRLILLSSLMVNSAALKHMEAKDSPLISFWIKPSM